MDNRISFLAERLVNYSCALKQGEKVLITGIGQDSNPLIQQLIKETYKAGAYPYVDLQEPSITREIVLSCNEEQLEFFAQVELARMEGMDAYIGIRGASNAYEMSDVPQEKLQLYSNITNKVQAHRVNNTKWVVLRYPNASMSQMAKMSQSQFEDFYFDVCNLDYAKMAVAMESLTALMERTDMVRIAGPGTDFSFSIKGIPAVPCCGRRNIPDGEVYTAPVKDSVNGHVAFNTPSLKDGFIYSDIYLEFENGIIVKASGNDNERINEVLDIDEGARYIGEFALGVNPYITVPMADTLFDEKIMGSFHFTPGNAYALAFNGNVSKLHWDLVCIQTPEYGGGRIYFDDILIRDNGIFVVDELLGLNPENLK
ncbi:MAG: aminopeptidase [Eubacteriaceae bacterium]|nr:aminopeptidase [Eubacteriaceae bacterium]